MMAAVITSREVETAVRLVLAEQGYELSIVRTHGETGADIVAMKGDDILHIEAIAFKSSPPARARITNYGDSALNLHSHRVSPRLCEA
jgi:hypothetical protein